MTHPRITWIDTMKAFSIMAVVLNHTQILPEIKTIVYLVCLPAFFFTAGMFTNTLLSPREFFVKKTLRLLIPYIIWGGVSWLSWYFIDRHYGADANNTTEWWEPLWGMVCGQTHKILQNPPLWFLCCMMCIEWLYYCVCCIKQKILRWLLILFLAGIGCAASYYGQNWPWEISAAMIIIPIYSLGAEYRDFIKNIAASIHIPFLLLLLLISLIGVGLGYFYNGYIALAETRLGNPLLYYISALSVVSMWFSISILMKRTGIELQGLQYIGQNTLFILCAHKFSFGLIKGFALLRHTSLSFFESTPGCLCLWVGTFVILMPLAAIVNRFFPFMIGRMR